MDAMEWFGLCMQQIMVAYSFFFIFISFFGMVKGQIVITLLYGVFMFTSIMQSVVHFNNTFCPKCQPITIVQVPGFYGNLVLYVAKMFLLRYLMKKNFNIINKLINKF